MLPTPTRFALVAGHAEGETPLTAFDAALMDAGVANVNLVKVSSILPPGARPLERLALPPGSLVPIAYGKLVAAEPGRRIAAAVAVGRGDWNEFGMIMEYTAYGTADEAEATIRRMVEESFTIRGGRPREVLVRAVDHVVERCGCVFAGCVLWYD